MGKIVMEFEAHIFNIKMNNFDLCVNISFIMI